MNKVDGKSSLIFHWENRNKSATRDPVVVAIVELFVDNVDQPFQVVIPNSKVNGKIVNLPFEKKTLFTRERFGIQLTEDQIKSLKIKAKCWELPYGETTPALTSYFRTVKNVSLKCLPDKFEAGRGYQLRLILEGRHIQANLTVAHCDKQRFQKVFELAFSSISLELGFFNGPNYKRLPMPEKQGLTDATLATQAIALEISEMPREVFDAIYAKLESVPKNVSKDEILFNVLKVCVECFGNDRLKRIHRMGIEGFLNEISEETHATLEEIAEEFVEFLQELVKGKTPSIDQRMRKLLELQLSQQPD